MTFSSHIRRIVLVAVIGCTILAVSAGAAAARPIDDPSLPNARTTQTHASSSDDGNTTALPIALAAAVVLVVVGTAGFAYRTRTSRRVIA
jgi:hypothetical protein